MALTRPTLLPTVAFDATQPHTFSFNLQNEGSQVVSNTLVIRNNDNNNIVYQENQENYKYEHIVNANELTNGTYYNAVVSVFDNSGEQSPNSIPIQFWCYTTPTLEFINIPSSLIIDNASFNFQFTYNQTENEPINSYVINLFNSSQTQIATSGVQYADNGTPPYNGNYTFSGFENNTVYYIQIVATTIEGTIVSTSLEQFTVQYLRPDLFTLVQLTNNCDEGYITITSNIVSIAGEGNPEPPVYINNKEVDLTSQGSWVQWTEGFNVTGDILSRIWFRNPNPYSNIVQFSNTEGQIIKVNFMLGYKDITANEMEAYIEVYVESTQGLPYYIYSNYVSPLSDEEEYVIYLTRQNSIYTVQLLTA